jgi:hypothetical protein
VSDLVKGPQVDAVGAELGGVAVVEPAVLAEPVEEDQGGAGVRMRQWR